MRKSQDSDGTEAAESLYLAHGRELWARLYAFCCDRELALDALHEAFCRLSERGYATVEDPVAWLLQTGRNWLIDRVRRTRRTVAVGIRLESFAGQIPEPDALIGLRELNERVRDTLIQLAAADREILVLRYALEWPSAKIAAALGVSVTAVDMRLSRARYRMAAALEAVGVNHEVLD